ncbi:hypothetical protein, partial [uncultured Microscilla sp.]|uniref:hypothetical protein n=1 Tax=uncultured Microscilla sp. TaxID=432653 RepID=UPI00260C9BBA
SDQLVETRAEAMTVLLKKSWVEYLLPLTILFFASVCVFTNRLVVAPVNSVFQSSDQLVETRAEAMTVLLKKSWVEYLLLSTILF